MTEIGNLKLKRDWKFYSVEEKLKRIIELFKKEGPMTIRTASIRFRISQPTMSKYLAILEAEGKVKLNYYGPAKVYEIK